MKKRKRLPRLLHGAFCLGAVLLALVFVRFTCGPTQLLTEKAALRRAQRQSLHIPREPVYTREIAGSQFFAVWDGQELYTYTAQWVRPFRKGYSYNANGETGFRLMRTPLIREYSWCYFWNDSGEYGWGCPGVPISWYKTANGTTKLVSVLPLLVLNDDPAVTGGVCNLHGIKGADKETGLGGAEFSWPRGGGRTSPFGVCFEIQTPIDEADDAARAVLSDISVWKLGYVSPGYRPATAAAEIFWGDDSGNVLYRQEIELIEQGEGSEEHGA